MKRSLVCLAVLVSVATLAIAAKKEAPGSVIDSGIFHVMVNGKQIGTETFKIQERAGTSVTNSTIKVEAGGVKAEQSSTLELTTAGELIHYSWKEQSPGRAQTTVEVSTYGALLQRVTASEKSKTIDVPYMASPATFILDDNFFTHRQLLVWRYLATCQRKDEKLGCSPLKLGILVPAQHVMSVVTVEVTGPEKLAWKGAEREFLRLKLSVEDTVWDIWVDPADSFKIQRIVIPANKTEVLRS